MKRRSVWLLALLTFLIPTLMSSLSRAQCLQDANTTPEGFVKNFYDWYTSKAKPEKTYEAALSQKKACFAPDLLKVMERVQAISALCPDEVFLDYDPIISTNGFGPSEVTTKVGTPQPGPKTTDVPVVLSYPGGVTKPQTLIVKLVKIQSWQIGDLVIKDLGNVSFFDGLKAIGPKEVGRCMQDNKANAAKIQALLKN